MGGDPVSKIEALARRALEAAQAEREKREAAAKQNRERMPEVARVVDEFRAVFGDVRTAEAEEGGVTWRAKISGEDGGDEPRVRRNGKWVYGKP